ncbi:MAG: RtcB family protein [Candidatus Omnitrophica bacterium]|nr:RtcB family protein [Candidatus Omnitrophota bacterium]
MSEIWEGPLEKIDDFRWRIPKAYKPGMRVPGIIYADEKLLKDIRHDKAAEQVANVAFLPGIVNASMAMPDIHWGYGFPIGGVAATDIEEGGVVSPGGVGFDINCGVRLVRTNFRYEEIKDKLRDLAGALFSMVPSGVGSKGEIRVSAKEERQILLKGSQWAVENGYGVEEDLECTEENGAIQGADPLAVSERAYDRGKAQSGTLGSGNHFVEVQVIDQLYDSALCDEFNLDSGQVMLMIHSGSRGFGYQICDDYVKNMMRCLEKYNINVPDRQLACAPVNSGEAKQYLAAMRCAANYAWNNRQCLMHLARKAFEKVFSRSWQNMGMSLIYDVAHNIAKIEKYKVDGKEKALCVHRKGATRAFGPGNPALPERYKKTGQPVIIPGDMGRNSYLLVGTKKAEEETFGSTCHGAGRLKSRTSAARSIDLGKLLKELESKGIVVLASGRGTIIEEAPEAYKDVNEVVNVVHSVGISKRVCRMKPLAVIKG